MDKLSFKDWTLGKRLFWGVAVILVMALMITSCGNSKNAATNSNKAYPPEIAYDSTAGAPVPQPSSAPSSNGVGGWDAAKPAPDEKGSASVMTGRKLIKDGNVTLETLNFEESVAALDRLIEERGGFSETRTIKGKSVTYQGLRQAYYIIRVPAESFESVMSSMSSIGSVLESNDQGTDITDQYVDFEARVKTLKVQEQTLLELMGKSSKLEDVITLESRIAEVRYEIERIENTLKNYDRLVAFSRIAITLQEVTPRNETKPVPETLGERISGSFTQSLEDFRNGVEDFLVWFVGSWITLLFMAIIAVGIVMIIRKRKKNRLKALALAAQQAKDETKQ